MIELDKIYNEDCLTGMTRIDEGSIDCIICDLPYGTTRNEWDSIIPLDKLWEAYKRIIKPNGAILLFSQQPFTSVLACSNLAWFKYEWIWQKDVATGFLNANRCPLKIHENILVFYNSLPTYNPVMRKGFEPYKYKTGDHSSNYGNYKSLQADNKGDRFPIDIVRFGKDRDYFSFHPTQKPVDVVRYLIQTYTNEGEVVLDNCMGSGTTAIAAIKEKRHFIGFETNKEYFDKSEARLKNLRQSPTLF